MARSRWLQPPRASASPASSWATCRSTSRRRRLCSGWRNISCDQPRNRPCGFALARAAALVPSDEVQRAFWLPLGRLSEPGVRREVTLTLRGGPRTFPAYLVDEELIWGMTERILTPFVDLVTSFDP